MPIEVLPIEVLSTTLSFLAKPKDVGNCAQVSKDFKSASESDIVWKTIAHVIYGENLAASTLHLYEGNWKAMIADDNRKGALPTLYNIKTCAWRMNGGLYDIGGTYRTPSYYYCTISCIKWDRKNRNVRVYIDVRGEADLRSPEMSSIRLRADHGCTQCDSLGKFVSELDEERPGHYKGYIEFRQSAFDSFDSFPTGGKCTFCYANRFQASWADYEPVEIFKFSPGFNFEDAFKKDNGYYEYSSYRSPYADDGISEEEERWSFVENRVLKRKHPIKWWA